jgi:hypothetical protein
MNHSENTLLIWVLTIAGILLAVLYSPLGSPDLYHPRKYFTENQCVNFNVASISHGSKDVSSIHSKVSSINSKVSSINANVGSLSTVKNSPKGKGSNSNPDAEINVPDASKNKKHYQNSGSSYSKSQNGRGVSIKFIKPISSIANSGNSNSNNTNYASNNAGSNGGSGETASASSNRSSHNTANTQNSGVSGVSVNLSAMDSTSLLASNYSAQKTTEFVDPGTGDPLGDPVPVPEGWGYLAFLALIYSLYILKKKRMAKITVENLSVS